MRALLDGAEAEIERLKAMLAKAARVLYPDGPPGDGEDDSMDGQFNASALDELLAELEARVARILALEAQVSGLETQLQRAVAELDVTRATVRELTEELSQAQTEKLVLERQLGLSVERIRVLEAEIEALKKQISDLMRIRRINEENIARLKATIDQLRKLLAGYQGDWSAGADTNYHNDPALMSRFREMQRDINKLLSEIDDLRRKLNEERDFFRRKFLTKWKDNTGDCEGCGLEFTLTLRRHHCRMCGHVFCSQCCKDRVQTSASKRPVRVCHDCNEFLLNIEQEDEERKQKQTTSVQTYGEMHEVVIERAVAAQPLGMDLSFDKDDDELVVTVDRLAPNGLAAQCGLRRADLVLELNGKAIGKLSQQEATEMMRGNPLTLQVKSQETRASLASSTDWLDDVRQRVRSDSARLAQTESPILPDRPRPSASRSAPALDLPSSPPPPPAAPISDQSSTVSSLYATPAVTPEKPTGETSRAQLQAGEARVERGAAVPGLVLHGSQAGLARQPSSPLVSNVATPEKPKGRTRPATAGALSGARLQMDAGEVPVMVATPAEGNGSAVAVGMETLPSVPMTLPAVPKAEEPKAAQAAAPKPKPKAVAQTATGVQGRSNGPAGTAPTRPQASVDPNLFDDAD